MNRDPATPLDPERQAVYDMYKSMALSQELLANFYASLAGMNEAEVRSLRNYRPHLGYHLGWLQMTIAKSPTHPQNRQAQPLSEADEARVETVHPTPPNDVVFGSYAHALPGWTGSKGC